MYTWHLSGTHPVLHLPVWNNSIHDFIIFDDSINFTSYKIGKKKVIKGELYYESEEEKMGGVGEVVIVGGERKVGYLRVREVGGGGEEVFSVSLKLEGN